MKKLNLLLILILITGTVSAKTLQLNQAEEIESTTIVQANYRLVTFCRNGIQWVMVNARGGLSVDYKLIDPNNPKKGITIIPCNY
jgi:hypothetical protein